MENTNYTTVHPITSKNKFAAFFAYLLIIPGLFMFRAESDFVRHHARQARRLGFVMALIFAFAVFSGLDFLPFSLAFARPVCYLLIAVLAGLGVYGMVNVIRGQYKDLPLIATIGRKECRRFNTGLLLISYAVMVLGNLISMLVMGGYSFWALVGLSLGTPILGIPAMILFAILALLTWAVIIYLLFHVLPTIGFIDILGD